VPAIKHWSLYAAPVLVGFGAVLGVLVVRNEADPVAEVIPGSLPIVAQPAPVERPEPVAAGGACADELTAVRGLMAAAPSGSLLDDAQNFQLTAGLTRVDDACSSEVAGEFRSQELEPWLTYLPPQV
jgi:hypothetical protein